MTVLSLEALNDDLALIRANQSYLWRGGEGWPELDFSELAFDFVNHSQYLCDKALQKSNAYNFEMNQNPSFFIGLN